jgi:hypothetical protein
MQPPSVGGDDDQGSFANQERHKNRNLKLCRVCPPISNWTYRKQGSAADGRRQSWQWRRSGKARKRQREPLSCVFLFAIGRMTGAGRDAATRPPGRLDWQQATCPQKARPEINKQYRIVLPRVFFGLSQCQPPACLNIQGPNRPPFMTEPLFWVRLKAVSATSPQDPQALVSRCRHFKRPSRPG